MVSARWKGKTVHSCMALTFWVSLYCFQIPPQKPCFFLHCFLTEFTILRLSPMRVDKSLSTCVCFVLWPGKCNRASLCSSCFSVASATTSVLVALKVWLCRLTLRRRGKEDGNSPRSSLCRGAWLQMLCSCGIHLPAFQGGDFSVC